VERRGAAARINGEVHRASLAADSDRGNAHGRDGDRFGVGVQAVPQPLPATVPRGDVSRGRRGNATGGRLLRQDG